MKKFLSLVLALVMTMSLVTVSAGAKDFTDDDKITYEEAVAVVSEIGVVDGYADGKFNPTNTLTRQAAAKIICNLILGPTTAAELHADTAPYKDVPATSEFAGYIAYCAKEGIISGYADGTFKPGNTLTGYAFMKMLLGALGYDQEIEGYVGGNWSINVAKQAINVGLNKGLEGEFNGIKAVNREEACLYAFNTLKADLVEYDTTISTTINGQTVTIGNSLAKAQKWNNSATRINNIKADDYIQFAEQYFPKLKKAADQDAFGRPGYTWTFKGEEIGTYVDWTQLVEEYTAKVTGKDLYNLLTATTIKDYNLTYFVDGAETAGIVKNDLYRTNTNTVGTTGNGIKTQVFVDDDAEEIVITSINTYLAKANADYNTKSETVSLQVYDVDGTGIAKTVDVDDIPAIEGLKKGDFVLVNWASDDVNRVSKEIQTIDDVEVMSDVTVTKFSKKNDDTSASQSSTDRVTALTTGGEEYKNNANAWYEAATLGDYNGDLLTKKTYDVYLDQFGYFIGAALHSGEDQYVFIAAYDTNGSATGIRSADALAIFTDGTMKDIKVNAKDTSTNITNAKTVGNPKYNAIIAADVMITAWAGQKQVNRWFTYTEENGVYTLAPVARYTVEQPAAAMTIKTDRLSLTPSVVGGVTYGTGRAFGNDDSVYITAENNTNATAGWVIDEITGVYTGIEDVRLSIAANDWIVAVYDKDNYIIAAVVLGEAEGAVDNYAYILSGANSEAREGDYYYWTFKAILNGEIQTMTIKSKYANTINTLDVNTVEELVLDGDGYVTKINRIPNAAGTTYVKGTNEVYDNRELDNHTLVTDYSVYDVACSVKLSLDGRTLHIDPAYDYNGLFFAREAKAVVSQSVNGDRKEVEYASVQEAYSVLADSDKNSANGLTFNGKIVAVLDANGVAQWVFFYDNTDVTSGNRPVYTSGARVLNLTYSAGTFNATAATTSNVTATSWTMSVYQGGILVGQTAGAASGNWTANTAYGVSATASAGIAVSGSYNVVLTIYNGSTVVASGEATFVI